MRLHTLTLDDFLGHERLELEFGPVTVVAGRNNAGKSAVKDAIELALTGTARTTDKAGRGAASLIRAGAERFSVSLAVSTATGEPASESARDQELTITRTRDGQGHGDLLVAPGDGSPGWGGSPKQKQEALLAHLGVTKEAVRAMIHAGSVAELSPEEIEELLVPLLGLTFDLGDVERLAQESGATSEDCQLLYDGPQGSFLAAIPRAKGSGLSPAVFDDAHTFAFEKRRQAKRDRGTAEQELEAAIAGVKALEDETPELRVLDDMEGWLKRNTATLAELSSERDERLKTAGKVETAPSADEEARAAEAYHDAEEFLAACEAWTERAVKAGASDLAAELKGYKDAWDESRETVLKKEAALAAVVHALEEFSGDEPTCPAAGVPCPLKKEQRAEVLKKLRARKKRLKTAHGKAERASEKVLEEYQEFRELAGSRPMGQWTLEELREALETKHQELERIRERRASAGPEEPATDLDELTERIAKGRQKLALVRRYQSRLAARDQARTKRDELMAQVEAWERLVKALGPGGAKAHAVDDRLVELQRRINARLAEYAPGYAVTLQGAEKGLLLEVMVPRLGGEQGQTALLPVGALSTSERLRVGVALQDAIAHLTGLGFLVVDNWDMLDAPNRTALGEAFKAWSEEYGTILVLVTRAVPPSPSEARTTYWLEDGEARVIA